MFNQYINGKTVVGTGQPFDVMNPATNAVVATLNAADAVQTQQALRAAQDAFPGWAHQPVTTRVEWLYRFRDACVAEKEVIAELIHQEVGLSWPESLGEVDTMTNALSFFGEEVKRKHGNTIMDYNDSHGDVVHIVEPFPVGVIVAHIAWNHPLYGASAKFGAALASGCTCVIKPSASTPLATLYLGVVAEKIGLPAGILNILSGPSSVVGKLLNESTIPAVLGVIGSSETGLQVMRQGASSVKRYSLELGGNAPAIVMPDASMDDTVRFMIKRKCWSCGQGCSNINRIYVHNDIHDLFINTLLEAVGKVRVGWGKELGDVMGPQVERAHRDEVLCMVEDAVSKGAKLLYGGNVPEELKEGNFIMPTVLDDCDGSMRICHEELFAPIFAIYRFSDLDEVLVEANNTPYGLASYLYTHDSRVIGKCAETLAFGMVYVNTPTCSGAYLPHIGIKQSGIGCDVGALSLEDYYYWKRVSIRP